MPVPSWGLEALTTQPSAVIPPPQPPSSPDQQPSGYSRYPPGYSPYPMVAPHPIGQYENEGLQTNLSPADADKMMAGIKRPAGAAPPAPAAPIEPPPGARDASLEGLPEQDTPATPSPPPAAAVPSSPATEANGDVKSGPKWGLNALATNPDQAIADAQAAAAAQPRPAPESTPAGIGKNAAAGVAEGGINLLAAPVNLANTLANLPIKGANALLGTQIPQFSTDVGGEASRALAHATGGFSPTEVPAEGQMERMVRAAGNVVASLPGMALGGAGAEAMLPGLAGKIGGAVRALPVAPAIAPVMAGAAAGQAASEAVPPQYAGLANLAGNVAGGGLTGLVQEGVAAAYRGATGSLGRAGVAVPRLIGGPGKQTVQGPYGPVRATQSQMNAAARSVYHNAGGEELRAALNALPAKDVSVPGVHPTTADVAQLPAAANMQNAMAQHAGPAFQQRSIENNTARVGHLQEAAPAEANPASFGDLVALQLAEIEDQGQRAVAGASGGVQGQTSALGGLGAPEERGAALRAGPKGRYEATHPAVSALWNAIDPTGSLGIHIGPLKQAQREIAGELIPTSKLHPSEQTVFDGVAKFPDVVSFRTLSGIRRDIGAAERDIAGAQDTKGIGPQALRRLGILKAGVDQSIADTVNLVGDREAAQVAAGHLAPDDTMFGRIQQTLQGSNAGTEATSGGNLPAGAVVGQRAGNAGDGVVRSAARRTNISTGGNARPSAGGSGLPSKAGPSLVSYLRSKGGVQDQGGDLAAMDAGRQLIRPKGLTLDHAREIAEEEGYLRPGSDINDLLNAIDGELRGSKVFTTTDDVVNSQREMARTAGGRGEAARERAAFAVSEAENGMGLRLSQEEHDHATQLVGEGMHPQEAIRQAGLGTDERVLAADASRQEFGRLGVPADAEQSEIGGTRLPATAPSFDAIAAERYASARGATLNEKQTYGQGIVGKMLRKGPGGAEHAIPDAKVASTLLNGQPDEAVGVADYLKAGGSSEALKQALVGDLRDKGIIGSDGMVQQRGLAGWVRRHGRTIERVPGLGDQLKSAADAQRMVDDLAASHAAAVKEYRNGIAKNFLKGEEPEVAVRKVLTGLDSARNLNRLIDMVNGDRDAIDSLKLHVVNFILDHTVPESRAVGDAEHAFINANKFKAWVDQNKAPLRRLFGGQGINNFDRVRASLTEAQRPPNAVAGSQTNPNRINAGRHGIMAQAAHGGGMALMAVLGEQLAEHLGSEGIGTLAAAGGGALALHLIRALRAAGIERVNDLKAAAMLHPELARELVARVSPDGKIGLMAGRRLLNVLRSMSAANLTGQETRH